MKTLIHNATIVNEGRIFSGSVLIDGDRIAEISEYSDCSEYSEYSERIEADGLLLLPGVIDTHVHFRDGGDSENPAGDFATESRAARAGGVTSVIDMPNTNPQTVNLEALERKEQLAARVSAVNYGFMLGATNSNIDTLLAIDPKRYAAIKLFLGSSTGNMLVNDTEQLDHLFRDARKLIVAHCESESIVQANMQSLKQQYQGTAEETAALHPKVRTTEACFVSTYRAIERARRFGTRLHIAHVSTAAELELLSNFDLCDKRKHVTAEVTPNHLCFDDRDYAKLGNLIKCNPSIKTNDDSFALWMGLADDRIDTIGSDHAPHTLEAKQRPYFDAPSGIPSIQHTLQMMLEEVFLPEAVNDPNIPKWRDQMLPMIVQKMCHNPAMLFGIEGRGFIRPGYKADLVLVRPDVVETVTRGSLLYKCGWSPLEGQSFHTHIERVWVNGKEDGGAEQLTFNK